MALVPARVKKAPTAQMAERMVKAFMMSPKDGFQNVVDF
jgi:hypothetical protein